MNFKSLIFFAYYKYNKFFPVNRGKAFLSHMLNKMFGTFWVPVNNKIHLELFINSSMDLSYLEQKNESHGVAISAIDQLLAGDVFVDIGANIGYLSIIAAQKVGIDGKVFAFEPSYREYKRLLNNIEKNKIRNILAFNCAAGDRNGSITLQVEQSHTGLNKIRQEENATVDGFYITVPMFRLDHIIQDPTIHLVKIDVEGAEFLVLKGMRHLLETGKVKKLIIEITPKFLAEFGSTKEDLYSFLRALNYLPKYEHTDWQYDEIFELQE